MPFYNARLKDDKEKVTTINIASPSLSEAERDARSTARSLKKTVVSVSRASSSLDKDENWSEHTARKF